MKILLTGGTGFIGSVVARMLCRRGDQVRCLVRPNSRLGRIGETSCEFAYGDITDGFSLREAARSCDGIIHLAGISRWDQIDSANMYDTVVGGTRNVLDAAVACGVERLVYVSSTLAVAASQRPVLHNESAPFPAMLEHYPYALAKHHAEALCRKYSDRVHVSIVNPGKVYGPDDRDLITAGNLIDLARSNPVMVCNGGMSVCHVNDVASAIIAAFERGRNGERYIIAGENVTVRRLAEITNDVLSLKKNIITFPSPVARSAGWFGRTFSVPMPFNPHVVPYATLYWFTDNTKAATELHVRFRNATETIRSAVEWCVNAGRLPALKATA